MTNKAFMSAPRPVLAASGPGNLLFVNRFIVRHDLGDDAILYLTATDIFLDIQIYFSSLPKWGLSFQLLDSII